MSNRGIEFSNQDDSEKYKDRKDKELQINNLFENIIWLGETYLELHKGINIKRVKIEENIEDMYLGELYDYMDEYRENIVKELRSVYNGLLVIREYCNKSMLTLHGIDRLIEDIEIVL